MMWLAMLAAKLESYGAATYARVVAVAGDILEKIVREGRAVAPGYCDVIRIVRLQWRLRYQIWGGIVLFYTSGDVILFND